MDPTECFGPSTDVPPPLSARDTGCFAYLTIRDRLPIILTKVIDGLARDKDVIIDVHGPESRKELKEVIGRLSKLKNEIQTDKPVELLQDSGADVSTWNEAIERVTRDNGSPPTWFFSAWLLVECYMYRRLYEAFQLSALLNQIDPFFKQKQAAFHNSLGATTILAHHLWRLSKSDLQKDELRTEVHRFVRLSLWGNKCDLSISSGMDNSQLANPLSQLDGLERFILVDDTKSMWNRLQQCISHHEGRVRMDIILDNAGFELVTDLCLADFLCSSNLVQSVVFHTKVMPWFVSDTTPRDFDWTLETMTNGTLTEPVLGDLGHKWKKYLESGRWRMTSDPFWTTPYDYSEMARVAPKLHAELSRSHLLVFKGDLNYRKLTGDLKWDPTTPFCTALRGFQPAALCTLRTVKADVVVGLGPHQAETIQKQHENWMISGDYAVIQFHEPKS